MAEQIIGADQHMWKIDNSGAGVVVGSMALTTGSIEVIVNVSDYISVTPSGTFYTNTTQSGAFLTTLGSTHVNNFPNTYPGSVSITTNPLPISGLVNQGTNPWITFGSVNVNNFPVTYPGSNIVSAVDENQRILTSDDAVTTVNYVDSNKDSVSNIVTSSAGLTRKVTDTYNNSGATTLILTRVVANV